MPARIERVEFLNDGTVWGSSQLRARADFAPVLVTLLQDPSETLRVGALEALRESGAAFVERASKRLVGLLGEGPVPVRAGAQLVDASGAVVGKVSSGTVSPTLGKSVMLAYVGTGVADGAPLHALVRNQPVPVKITPLPFVPKRYRR